MTRGPTSQTHTPSDLKFAHDFLSTQNCLIVEPSQAFSSSVRACLQELGVPVAQIQSASKYAQAKELMQLMRPTILITEYKVETFNGFELVEMQEKMHEESKRISFITSKSTSTAVVADAAEGQIDGYLLKPFSIEVFRKYFVEILRRKSAPSPYLQKLSAGKMLREKGEHDLAIKEFLEAKAMNPKPALACYQLGETYRLKGDIAQALRSFQEGRVHVPLHYKCVTGEFETLLQSSQYGAAQNLVPTIRTHFPMNATRLAQLFTTVLQTKTYEELPELFNAYRELDERTPELTSHAENAFFEAGQNRLKTKNMTQATMFFETSLQIAGRSLDVIEKVITEFLNEQAHKEADAFLAKASPSDVGTPGYIRLSFRVNQQTMTSEQLLNKGRELIFAGHGTPEIFQIVVRSFAQAGKETMAETAISKAVESFPEMRTVLYKVLEENLPKSASSSKPAA